MFWSREKKRTTHNQEDTVMVKQKELAGLIRLLSDHHDLGELDITKESPLYPLFTLLQQEQNARQKSSEAALQDINKRVEKITSISSIHDMIQVIEDQTGDVNNLAAQAQEMSASATEIAATTSNAATFVEQSLGTASAGVMKVKEAIGLVDRSFSEFQQTNTQVQDVLKSMGEIEEIVGLIAGVADQTNLLALNAAIEAARAGDQGKGFAVVADEVRKLAEDTKSSVGTIRNKIGVLNQDSQKTADSIFKVSKNMNEGKTTMQQAESSMGQILDNIHSIATDIRHIATGNDEQSTTLQSFGQTITGFAASAENTLSHARDAGQGIYQISQELIDIRQKRVQNADNLSLQQALEIYKTDHLCWSWRIYNMLLGYETVHNNELESSDTCDLGKWLQRNDSAQASRTARLDDAHRKVHALGRDAVLAHNNRDHIRVEQIRKQLASATHELIVELDTLSQS